MITEETLIKQTGMPYSIKNILIRCYIYTIGDLIKRDIEGLKRINGIGNNRINKINQYLNENGFFL